MEPRVTLEAGIIALARNGVAPAVIAARLGVRRTRVEKIITKRRALQLDGGRA